MKNEPRENWQEDYDWKAAFAYAQPGTLEINDPGISAEGFEPKDVACIFACDEGENDGPSWLMFGRLKDGRYFFLEAGCDYTGWDCQASGTVYVAASRRKLISTAMGSEARERLGV